MERVKDDEKSLWLCISVLLQNITMSTGNMRVFKYHLCIQIINAKRTSIFKDFFINNYFNVIIYKMHIYAMQNLTKKIIYFDFELYIL